MSYKQSAAANRDALFGSAGGEPKKKKKGGSSSKKTGQNAGTTDSNPLSAPSRPASAVPSSKGYQYGGNKKKTPINIGLTGEAKAAKMKEADDYKDKAKKTMQRGIFAKPDPLAASTFYKRAADAYQVCGEDRLERLSRINSADCQ
jgi:hypothetical protein